MATATATKVKGVKIRELSIKAIKRDPDLQSRAAMSMDHAREFSEAMLRGEVFPAVEVVEDESGENWLFNGWHRVLAAEKAGIASVRAEIRQGTKEDAIALAAAANKEFSIKRTPADVERACRMLFCLPDWWAKTNKSIAEHVGCSHQTVKAYRARYASQNGIEIPLDRVCPDGSIKSVKVENVQSRPWGNGRYHLVREQDHSLVGHVDKGMAVKRLEDVKKRMSPINKTRRLYKYMRSLGAAKGIVFGMVGGVLRGNGFIIVFSHLESETEIFTATGKLLIARAQDKSTEQAVLLCPDKLPAFAILRAVESLGVRVMNSADFESQLPMPTRKAK